MRELQDLFTFSAAISPTPVPHISSFVLVNMWTKVINVCSHVLRDYICPSVCSSDSEIIGYALDTLYNIISNDLEEEEQGEPLLFLSVFNSVRTKLRLLINQLTAGMGGTKTLGWIIQAFCCSNKSFSVFLSRLL